MRFVMPTMPLGCAPFWVAWVRPKPTRVFVPALQGASYRCYQDDLEGVLTVGRTGPRWRADPCHSIWDARMPLVHPGLFLAGLLACSVVGLIGSARAQEGGGPAREESKSETEPQASTAEPRTLADARALFLQGDYDAAARAYEALRAGPDAERDATVVLSASIGLAECRIRVGQYEDAGQLLEAAKDDASAEWHYARARLDRILGRYDDALSHAKSAISLRKDHAGARRLLAETLETLGRRDDAIEAYRWFDGQIAKQVDLPRDPEWLTDAAVGFVRYSVLTRTNVVERTRHALHEMLQPAYERLDRLYWPARVAAGDLLRARFNNSEESGSASDYLAALRIDGNLAEAHVGLGLIALENWGFEEIERRVDAATKVNPRFAPAMHLLGAKLIIERRYEQAIEQADRALAINANDLDALSIRAAACACMDDQRCVDAARERVERIHPGCATLERTIGDALSTVRQFADSERALLKAVESDPTDANARTVLGMMYMNWGEEGKARDALDAAWALDPFNERTKFMLELLEQLHKFARFETAHFLVKYDASQDPGLGEYVAGYLEDIYEEVTGDFETPLGEKTVIELFPTHRAFGVRITGRPFIYTIGASTGRVIALVSPRESPETSGPYNLSRVLKHEFTHTVTLAATRNRIPHWFTEGLAVYGEDAPRSFAWHELLADAARRDQLFTIESINWRFIRPRRPNDRQMAYAQSEWMCEYLVGRFGYAVIQDMLNLYRDGKSQPQVFAERLGLSTEQFDGDFKVWALEQIAKSGFDTAPPEDADALRASFEANPQDASLAGRLAKAELDAFDFEKAGAAAERALELDANEPNALESLASVLQYSAKTAADADSLRALDERALPILERLTAARPQSWTAAKFRAEIAVRRKERDIALESYKRLQRLCPIDPASWRGLAGLYLEGGMPDDALPQLMELANLEEHDAEIPAQIGRIYRKSERLREAQQWYRRAIGINPFSPEYHRALGDVSMQLGDTAAALREYTMLTHLEPKNVKNFESAAVSAQKLGNHDKAKSLARKAVELDPESPVKAILDATP